MNMHSLPKIRQATKSDAVCLAQLIDIAGEGIPSWLWAQSCDAGQTPLERGVERAKRTAGGFSFKNALVAEQDGGTLGMVLSYPITNEPEDDLADLADPVAPFVALEKQSVGTWYINALVVFAGNRSRGIGVKLLKAAEALALEHGTKVMSIQAYAQNAGAVRLYQRLGYEMTSKAAVLSHPCQPYYTGDVLLLTKQL